MPQNWKPGNRCARAWRSAFVCLCLAGTALLPAVAQADARSQAKRMHDRLAGVPPTEAVLTSMTSDIAAGRSTDAANTAMQHRAFYDVTLKNFAMPWTNRDQTVFAPLNDYVATESVPCAPPAQSGVHIYAIGLTQPVPQRHPGRRFVRENSLAAARRLISP